VGGVLLVKEKCFIILPLGSKGGRVSQPEVNVKKFFTAANYKWAKEARAFVLCRPFHPSLRFVGKARSLVKNRVPKSAPLR
jgi:hypothetical protein